MNKTLKIAVALVLLFALLLSGCQKTEPEKQSAIGSGDQSANDKEAAYTVTVVDGEGKPHTTGIIVAFFQGDKQVFIRPVDENGKVEKTLPLGDYTVELQFTGEDAQYYYDDSDLTLSAEKTELEIQVIPGVTGTPVTVFDSTGQSDAWAVEAGSTFVPLEDGRRNYFLFSPKMAGTYRFTTSDPNAAIGNYGYTAYIQNKTITTVTDNAFVLSIGNSMVSVDGSNPLVIGVDASGLEGCVLIIQRIGDPEYSIEEDEPWQIYQPTVELQPYVMPEGIIHEFDLTADASAYPLVFNAEDQSYHLYTVDGPQVLVRLSEPTQYLDAFSKICTTTGIKKYFYDDNGDFLKREDYTSCMQTYSNVAGDNGNPVYVDQEFGVYPLTEDLKYIIQNHGEYVGWWDVNDPGFLFMDSNENKLVGLNPEIAWLFACCYLETEDTPLPENPPVIPTDPTDPTDPDDPAEPTDPDDPVQSTDPTRPGVGLTDPTRPVVDPTDPTQPVAPTDPSRPVIDPTDPTRPVVNPTDPTRPVADPTEPSDPVAAPGTQGNPVALTIGSNTAAVTGNGGYYFKWTATQNATLALDFTSNSWSYQVRNLTAGDALNQSSSSEDDAPADPAQIPVLAGDELLIIVNTANGRSGSVRFDASFSEDLRGTRENPYTISVEGTTEIRVAAGQTVHLTGRVHGMTMRVRNASDSKVKFNGKTYKPSNGVIRLELPMAQPGQAGTLLNFMLSNNSDTSRIYTIEVEIPVGTFNNPDDLTLGTNTASIENVNEGYVYQWTATGDGTLTIKMEGNNWYYQVQNLYSYQVEEGRSSDGSANPVSIEVEAGQVIKITVNTGDDAEASITFTATFQ